jgi:hypothetical protein
VISINIYQPPNINADINIPTEWNDLEENELHFIAKTLLQQSDETANQSRGLILDYIISNRVTQSKIKLPVNFFLLLDPEQMVIQLYPQLDFIFEKNDRTNLPAAILWRGWGRPYFPQPFDEITCAEFEDCEVMTSQFAEDPSGEKLAHLAAILFRPKKSPYMKYHAADDTYITYKSEKKIKQFLKLKPEQLYSILIWYAGCRAQLPLYFPDIYDAGKTNGVPDPMVFTKSIHAGAGPKNGTRNQIRTTKLYEFLYECNQEAIKAKELQEEYDKMNSK